MNDGSIANITTRSLAEANFVDRGRAAFAELFPDQDFDASTWNFKHLKKAGAGGGNIAVNVGRWALNGGNRAPPSTYVEVVKAYFATSGRACGSLTNSATAALWLWRAIDDRLGAKAGIFTWTELRKSDAERAEELMIAHGMRPSTVYRRCVDLRALLAGVSNAGLLVPMNPTFRTARQETLDRYTLSGQEARMAKMPSEAAIHGLSSLFRGDVDLDEFEQLLTCVVTVMFGTGLRIQEVLHLAIDSVRREGSRYFLCYYKAKSKRVIEEKMALSTLQGELVSEALRRAEELTSDARVRARELVRSPAAFPLPAWAETKLELSFAEVAELLGCNSMSVYKLPNGVERTIDATSGTLCLCRTSLQTHLQATRERYSPESIKGVTPTADGAWLSLDRAAFIAFRNEGNGARGTNRLLVELVSQQQVGDFLGASNPLKNSIFRRKGLLESNGQPISLNAHQIRHYVTSKASSAGIADAYLVRWQRREHVGDLEAYKHLTIDERVDRLRELLRAGRLQGDIASMYFNIADGERDVFLTEVVQAIHVSHLGFCVHDFNTAPCPKAMNCVRGCGSFLFDTEDQEQRQRLKDLARRNQRALQDAREALASGNGILAVEWVAELEATNAGIETILATAPSVGASTIAPFPGQQSHFQPLE